MKKRLIQATVLAVFAMLVLAGCTFVPREISGTWSMSTGSGLRSQSLEFKLSKCTLTDTDTSGAVEGTWKLSIEDVDQGANLIMMKTTGTTGTWAGYSANGEFWYWIYEVSGDAIRVGISSVAYPSSTITGWYYKE